MIMANSMLYSDILLLYFGFTLSLSFSFVSSATSVKENQIDRLALLAIKSRIDHDPLGVTRAWNDSAALCQWKGITCGRRHQRVTMLDLSNQKLGGTVSSHIGNLSFLSFLYLENNNFHGEIPPEIGRLSRLKILKLGSNSFHGRIPTNLSHCSNLVEFWAEYNNLEGDIPPELGNLKKLEILMLYINYHLTGEIPVSLGNLSALYGLGFGDNSLHGRIPDTLSKLKRLAFLELEDNHLSGLIPPAVFNISSLKVIDVGGNQFHGTIPSNIGFSLPNLKNLTLGDNNFFGRLPESLSNASKLVKFDISGNYFSGEVSFTFSGLKNLSKLNFGTNNLRGSLDFLTSLTNCSRLQVLGLGRNQFTGKIPSSVANLSIIMTELSLRFNQISGTIPVGITNLVNLNLLLIEFNQLTGHIPPSIGNLKNLQDLNLGMNKLTGRIPASIGNISILTVLDLEYNSLWGSIPPEIGECQSLTELYLAHNGLTGSVPHQIFSIRTLSIILSLHDNLLSGSFPLEVGNLENLVTLDISGNRFSGEIPSTLGGCTSLKILLAKNNHFDGSIPSSLGSLRSIEMIDFSQNNLSGQIPESLEGLSFLKHLNLSFNALEGMVPRGGVFKNATAVLVSGNKKLCGGIAKLELPSCHFKEFKKSKIILIVLGFLGLFSLSCSVIFSWLKNKRSKKKPSSSALSLMDSILKVSYGQLLKTTDGFSSANLIGRGSFGHVYKGVLSQGQDRTVIAVKVMNLQNQAASKSFLSECKALRNIRHRNLVKIISACSSVDFRGNSFKALVYEFMANGSLERWLHTYPESNRENGERPKSLNFLQRLNIAIDVASALDYLHHHCHSPIVHCDLKPSNVLLDENMVAHVGDFGLARFHPKIINRSSADQTSSLGLKGTVGYAAPGKSFYFWFQMNFTS